MPLDLKLIVDGVVRNNMGFGGLALQVRGSLRDGEAVLAETGQRIRVQGGPSSSTRPWLVLTATAMDNAIVEPLRWTRELDAPVLMLGTDPATPTSQPRTRGSR